MSQGGFGFSNAPVTKFLVLGTVGSSLLAGMLKQPTQRLLTVADILDRPGRAWRLLVLPWGYQSTGELFFGTILLYVFRVFERHWGSRKFASYCFVAAVASLLVHLALFAVARSYLPVAEIRPGPYSVAFALLWRYFTDIPSLSDFAVLGVSITDKIFIYGLALQFLLSNGSSTVTAGLSGLVGGMLCSAELLRLHQFRFPALLVRLCKGLLLPLLQGKGSQRAHNVSAPPAAHLATLGRTDDGSPTQLIGGGGGLFGFHQQRPARPQRPRAPPPATAGAPPAAPPPAAARAQAPGPPEDSVMRLVELGFDRNTAIAALRSNGNDPDAAAAWLLG